MENIEYIKNRLSVMINLFKTRRFEELIDKGTVLIKKFPNQIIFYNITSLAYDAIGKRNEAKKILIRALKLDPNNFNVLNNLGLISANSGDNVEAEKYYQRALELNPDFTDTLINLGNLKTEQNKDEEAKDLFISALKVNNQIIQAKLSLAGYFERSGNFPEAESIYKEVLKNDPTNTLADRSISLIHKYKAGDAHIKIMEEKLIKVVDEDDKKRLSFALGKAYEDMNEYEKSFKFYEAGNNIYKNNTNFDIKKDIKLFQNIKTTFENNKTTPQECYGQKLIFIVGMPRSGTTLTEQILSSHKNVYGAGELSFLSQSIEKNFGNKEKKIDIDFSNFKPETLKIIKEEYLNKIKVFKNEKKYLIDKAPLNFRWIGLIKLIFPDSKIIHCDRNSMDVCWSNYKNTFSSNLMNYTYDFDDLANYYKLYADLMSFWLKKFDNNIFNIVYERLVANKEEEVKKLLNFCDLDWDDSCLNFHKNKKSVSTASLAQIRQPLYSSSVEGWKKYSKELDGLQKKLAN